MKQQLTLQRIDLFTALKFGFVLGAFLALIGATLFLLSYVWVRAQLLQSPFFAPSPFNPSPALPLPDILPMLLLLVVYVVFAAMGYAVSVWLLAVIYNFVAGFSGGLVFEVVTNNLGQAAPLPAAPVIPAAAQAFLPAPAFQPATAAPMGPRLVGAANPALQVALTKPITTIGSGMSNDLMVPSPQVAARHAEIRIENGLYILYDVSGGHQTQVLGRQIQGSNMLKDGFQVTLGDVMFVFHQ